jgi:cardiolipin synthase
MVCVLTRVGGLMMFRKNWKKEIFTIPNVLSFFRLALIPVYMDIYLNAEEPSHYYLAAAILAVSCLTDMIDGKIARHFNMSTTLGRFLDPVADKATQFTLIVCLAIRYPVLWYLTALFVIKEGFQLIAGLLTFRKGKMLTGALITGKVCTCVLFVSLILLVLMPNLDPRVINIITIVDGCFMFMSFVHYATVYYRQSPKIQDITDSGLAE